MFLGRNGLSGRGRDNHLLIAPRADPHERSLAHAALIADE